MKEKRIFSLILIIAMLLAVIPELTLKTMATDARCLKVSAGNNHAFAIKTDGSLWAWGINDSGEIGDGTTQNKYTPVKVMENVMLTSIGCGHSLIVKTDGSLWACGINSSGQLGDGTTKNRISPVKIMDNVTYISAAFYQSFAIRTDGSLWAWGYNYNGQLGDGTTNDRIVPVKIMDNVKSVSASNNGCMAIKTDGSLWAWGLNIYGQIGDGTTENRISPIKIMDNVSYVATGYDNSMAIKTDGSLWAWGHNDSGQLGDGTVTQRKYPVKIMDNVASVALDDRISFIIMTDGSLWATGLGIYGDGKDTSRSYVPKKVMDNVINISTGMNYCIITKSDGSLWGWGSRRPAMFGQGNPSTFLASQCNPVKILDNVAIPNNTAVSTPVSSGAVFSDQNQIKHTEAVGKLVSWNIIKGKDQGIFDPNGNVTRAEMCKMICIALNGGKEPSLSTKSTPTYWDTDGHWAEKYIEYCSQLCIVAGTGNGQFQPDVYVTGTQAAKIMLTAMGFNAAIEGYTGSDWAINIAVRANTIGLYNNLNSTDYSSPLNRDNAAQLIYNGVMSPTPRYTNGTSALTGKSIYSQYI